MLQAIREHTQGWIAWVIVIFLSIPFALWGIQSYLGVGSEPIAATVNGLEIPQREFDSRYQDTRLRLREQLGAAYRPDLFDEPTLRAQVLDTMIQETLLQQLSHELGLRASSQELQGAILSNPAFQKDGRFDKATYDRTLELQGMHSLQYEEGLRQRIVGTQLQRTLLASAFATAREVAEFVRLDRQRRQIAYIRLPQAGFDAAEEPLEEAALSAYYRDHQASFQTPERVKLGYLVLDVQSLGDAQVPTEEELRRLYEDESARFRQPEQRRARHILVALPAEANEPEAAKARARLEAIRARLAGGEDFATVAKEQSEDPGSASQGGDLGLFGRGVMDPAFDQAVFGLALNTLSEPVRSAFGYHLIEITEIQPEHVKPFEEVRDQLAAEAAKSRAEGLFYDWAERLANLVYETPDSLEPAAEALGLPLHHSDWIDRNGGEGLLAERKVVAAAFSDDVLREGLNSELIEPERNRLQAVVVRVLEHEEATVKPLEAVREDIAGILRAERATAAAAAAAQGLLARLQAGEDKTLVATGYSLEEPGLVARDAAEVPPGVRDLAFTLPRPAAGAATFGHTTLAQGDAAVVILGQVVDGDLAELDEAERKRLKDDLQQSLGRGDYEQWLSDLERRAKITREIPESASL